MSAAYILQQAFLVTYREKIAFLICVILTILNPKKQNMFLISVVKLQIILV